MRRRLYIAILRLHPAPFRHQFANEMLAIFDDPASHKYSRGLFTDAVLSLLRQWIVRPEFQVTGGDTAVPSVVPMFASLNDYRLQRETTLYGAALSAALFCSLIFVIGRPGIAPQWSIGARPVTGVVPATRSSMESPEPDTRVTFAERQDPWRALATLYFGQIIVLKALDTNRDLTISAPEMANAPAALRQLDKNHDGKLSAEECGFYIGPSSLSPKLTDRMHRDFMRFHPVLAALDSDRNGEISAEEIRNSAQSLRRLDINGDGSLSPSELIPHQAAAWVATIFEKFDTNHDGQISAAERARSASFGEIIRSADRNHDGFTTMYELTEELRIRENE